MWNVLWRWAVLRLNIFPRISLCSWSFKSWYKLNAAKCNKKCRLLSQDLSVNDSESPLVSILLSNYYLQAAAVKFWLRGCIFYSFQQEVWEASSEFQRARDRQEVFLKKLKIEKRQQPANPTNVGWKVVELRSKRLWYFWCILTSSILI